MRTRNETKRTITPWSLMAIFLAATCVSISLTASGEETPGEYYVFKALSDFPNTNAGEVPYYRDTGYRQALAIDAANVSYRGKFARAVRTFTGISDIYDVTITTVMEDDGESTYRLVVNGEIVADFQNPYVGPGGAGNGQQHTHIWEGIAIMDGDELGVESNTHSNQDIPESGGFAWSRGRWHQIELGEDPNDILPPSPVPPGAGLVHHWTLDADGTDSVGGLDGTVQGPVVAPGMVGNGLLFDGQDDSVEFTGFVPPLQGTIALWMNAASVGPRGRFLGSVDEFEVYVEDGLIANQLFSAGSLPNYVVSSTILVENTWYHVALTYDGASNLQQIYINGQLDAEGATADDLWDGGDFAFGHRADRTNQYYSGMLDDVRYYDEVLTVEEVLNAMMGAEPDIDSDLVAWWSFNDGSGTTAFGSVSGLDGTLVGDPTWTTGKVAGALKFDGLDDYVTVGPDEALNFTGSVTIAAWINVDQWAHESWDIVMYKATENWAERCWRLSRAGSNDTIGLTIHGQKLSGSTAVNDGKWHHIAGVFDDEGDMMYLYIDAVEDASIAFDGNPPASAGPLLIGCERNDGVSDPPPPLRRFWGGLIDEFRLYARALTAEDIQKLYVFEPTEPNLVHHWTLDADGTDSVGGLDGTVQGPVVEPGMVDNGLLFDGIDDSVDFTGFVPPLQGTIVLWMNAASVGPRGRFLGSVDEFEVYVENGLIANQLFSAGGAPNYVVSNTIFVENTWYHVALTYDGASNLQQIYINGELDAEGATADDPWGGGDFAFGHRADRTNQYYSGMLDDVRYYDKVLTMEEVRQLMN